MTEEVMDNAQLTRMVNYLTMRTDEMEEYIELRKELECLQEEDEEKRMALAEEYRKRQVVKRKLRDLQLQVIELHNSISTAANDWCEVRTILPPQYECNPTAEDKE